MIQTPSPGQLMLDIILRELAHPDVLPWPVLLTRLLGSVFLCGLIGLDREVRHRPAGLRTHMLVGLASTIYCILMLNLVTDENFFPADVTVDPLRIVEAVTGGVAFLAAGMVIFSRGEVHGLTTGAGMWLTASIGLCCGLGLWALAVVATVLALAIMQIVHWTGSAKVGLSDSARKPSEETEGDTSAPRR